MMLLVILSSFVILEILDRRMKKVLIPFLDVEAERFTTNLVNKALNRLDMREEYDSLLVIKRDDNSIEKISYNTYIMNQISSKFSNAIQKELKELENGKVDDRVFSSKRFHQAKEGILCEVSFGTLRNSQLFSNVGPVIPVRLLFLGQVMPDIDIKVKEYGINMVLIEVYFVATVKEQITMPFSSKRQEVVVNQLLTVDIIKGEVPNYYNGFSK